MSIRIESNFIDYYDHLQDTSSMKIYHRNDNMQLDRGRIFITLNKMGIRCLELKQVSYQPYTVENVVVYTDTKAHHSEGKKIMDISSALCSYQTYPSAECTFLHIRSEFLNPAPNSHFSSEFFLPVLLSSP